MDTHYVFEAETFMIRDIASEMDRRHPIRLRGGAIVLCKNGYADLLIDTRKYVLSAGTEAVLLTDCMVCISNASRDFLCTMFYFSKDMLFQASAKIESFLFHYIIHAPVYHYPEDAVKSMEHYFVLIKRLAADTENRYRNVIVTNLLRNILLDIYDKLQRNLRVDERHGGYTRAEELFNKFMDLVLREGTQHHDVQFYADQLCITTRYLTGITTKIAHRNPKQIIDAHLVQEIKIMLTFSELTLQQIADHLHFPDQSYLGRFFKKHTGTQPTSYRTQIMSM